MKVEACVRVRQKTGTDPDVDFGQTVVGDVIEMLPVGSDWGTEIMSSPDYRIVIIDEPATVLDSLMAGENGMFPHRVARKRLFQIDPKRVPEAIKDEIILNINTVSDLSSENITAMSIRKPDMF